MNRIEDSLLDLDFRIKSWLSDFSEEDRGATDIIAILVMIVVVIAVAAVFREKLTEVVELAFERLKEVFS